MNQPIESFAKLLGALQPYYRLLIMKVTSVADNLTTLDLGNAAAQKLWI
jgi:hypothetical protein